MLLNLITVQNFWGQLFLLYCCYLFQAYNCSIQEKVLWPHKILQGKKFDIGYFLTLKNMAIFVLKRFNQMHQPISMAFLYFVKNIQSLCFLAYQVHFSKLEWTECDICLSLMNNWVTEDIPLYIQVNILQHEQILT